MAKVLILVEGATEERFTKKVPYPFFSRQGIFLIPKIITTKRPASGPHYKGGITDYGKVKREIKRLLNDTSASLVTTMIDYYRLPLDFPGRGNLPSGTCFEKVGHIEREFAGNIDNIRFSPYLQLHEFEAILFSSIEGFVHAFPSHGQTSALKEIVARFNTPEEINDGDRTAPSKRIQGLFPKYQKPFHGALIASSIGIDVIREKCRRFNEWVEKLISLKPNTGEI